MSATTTAHIISYDPAAIERWEALGAGMATAPGGDVVGRKWWQYRWFDSEEHEVMKQQQAFALAIFLTNAPSQAEREAWLVNTVWWNGGFDLSSERDNKCTVSPGLEDWSALHSDFSNHR